MPYARGGRPGRPSAHGVPGVAESPPRRDQPRVEGHVHHPHRPGTSEAERCYRVNGLPLVGSTGGATSPVHRGRRWQTGPNTRRRRPPLSPPRAPWNTPAHISVIIRPQGQEAVHPPGRKWHKPRQGPCRSPWWRPPYGQEPDDGNCKGRGLLPRRQAPFEADGDSPDPGQVRGPGAATPKARDGAPLGEGHLP